MVITQNPWAQCMVDLEMGYTAHEVQELTEVIEERAGDPKNPLSELTRCMLYSRPEALARAFDWDMPRAWDPMHTLRCEGPIGETVLPRLRYIARIGTLLNTGAPCIGWAHPLDCDEAALATCPTLGHAPIVLRSLGATWAEFPNAALLVANPKWLVAVIGHHTRREQGIADPTTQLLQSWARSRGWKRSMLKRAVADLRQMERRYS